jgi:pilus assembly protein CpaE
MKPIIGEISTILNVESTFSWLEVTKNISRLDPTYIMSILTQHTSGIYVLPSPDELTEDYTANPQALATLLRLMQTMFDFIVIDNGQSLDDTSMEVLKISDSVLLVCVLSLPCIINLKRLQDTFQKHGYPEEEKIGIIANRFIRKSEISLKDAEESLNKKILFRIPNAYKISMNAINQGIPLCTIAQGTEIWRKYRELASTFPANGTNGRKEKKGKGSFSLTSFFGQA